MAGKTYGEESDLWGMGVILFVMLSLTLPFGNEGTSQVARGATNARVECRQTRAPPRYRWRH